jgi:hypothetical protein
MSRCIAKSRYLEKSKQLNLKENKIQNNLFGNDGVANSHCQKADEIPDLNCSPMTRCTD